MPAQGIILRVRSEFDTSYDAGAWRIMKTDPFESVPHVCEVFCPAADGALPDAVPDLLIELPHGATRTADFDRVRRLLISDFPDQLSAYFYVNTDVGSFECAREIARCLVRPGVGGRALDKVLILRSLIPRTFIDCNRLVAPAEEGRGKMTPALPQYITAPEDRQLLQRLHDSYQEVAQRAYDRICGEGGMALQLHTYAPRSVGIDRIDADIVDALRKAYDPAVYETWERRPDVDIISEAGDGTFLAPPELVTAVKSAFAGIGIEAGENATYRLHAETMGHHYSARFAGRVLCIEISRAMLADPFSPFEEMRISSQKVERMSAPIVRALLDVLR
jgi:hypothetical protein